MKVERIILISVLVLIGLGGLYYCYAEQDRRTSEALARAEKAEEQIRKITDLDQETAWAQIDDASRLLATDLKENDRKEASERLKEAVRCVKGRLRYPQLRHEP